MKNESKKQDNMSNLLKQYILYVEMMDRISSRRIKSNYFYISLLSITISIFSIIIGQNLIIDQFISLFVFSLIAVIGILLCITWFIHICSYRQLNDAKFVVIHKMEEKLPYKCYKEEWEIIKEKRYVKLTKIEQLIPIIFIIAYCILFSFSIYNLGN